MLYAIAILLVLVVVIILFMQQPKFGKLPSGARLERIKRSPNFRDGKFQNLSHTPDLTDGATYYTVLRDFFFKPKPRRIPVDEIPHVKTDLKNLPADKDVLVWFGHASYFMQVDGKKILVDPVLSGVASPLAFTTREFKGTGAYTANEIPEIDYLFISHDHWDHVDYPTLVALKPKIRKVICGLGVGAHLEAWGYDPAIIEEHDWNEDVPLDNGFSAHTVPARHFSGRGFSRNHSLWTSYVLQTPSMRIFIGGDSGYDKHFAEAGKKFGPFDLAILENGQYDKSWKYIHMMPDEVLKAAKWLHAKRVFPVHSAKFALGNHPWDEPLKNITEFNKTEKLAMITPMIGEPVNLKDGSQRFGEWWVNVN